MLDTADVTRQFIETIIEIIGRKTSKEYAAVTIRNLLKKLQREHSFFEYIEVKNTRFAEIESTVVVQESLNGFPPKQVGMALKDLLTVIMKSLGKTAGYFFLRETRERIGFDYDTWLLKTMDVDLTLMQSTFIVEKKTVHLLDIQNSDIVRQFLKALMNAMEKQTSKTFVIGFLVKRIDVLREQFSFLNYISINDVRYTLGSEELLVQQEINTIDAQEVGRAIKVLLDDVERSFADIGRTSVAGEIKMQLTLQYLARLGEMGVTITPYNVGYHAVFIHVLKTFIDVLAKTRRKNDAISMVNGFLRKIDSKYELLKSVKVEPAINDEDPYHIVIPKDIDAMDESDVRRAIQQLLESAMDSVGAENNESFLQQFKESLEKKYLSKIEEIGVNFHMIELHHALLNQSE